MIKVEPATFEQAASMLQTASTAGQTIRVRGGGTKLGWGTAAPATAFEMHTGSLGRILEHNVGDLTAILEAGVPLAAAQDGVRCGRPDARARPATRPRRFRARSDHRRDSGHR